MPKVFIMEEQSFDSEFIKKAVNELNLHQKLTEAKKILIKPNLAAGNKYDDQNGVVTSRIILERVLIFILEINKEAAIYLVESDGTDSSYAVDKFSHQHYEELCQYSHRIKQYDLSGGKQHFYESDGRYFKKGIELSDIFLSCDFFISLSKIKTHYIARISGILKNQFGCLPEADKSVYHPYLHQVIADINQVISPDLAILEACPAMEGNGPIQGIRRSLKKVLLSDDAVAIDTVMAKMMGVNPKSVKYLRYGWKDSRRTMNMKSINIEGTLINHRFKFISQRQQLYIRIGLWLQQCGGNVSKAGKILQKERSFRKTSSVIYGNMKKKKTNMIKYG